MLAALKGHLIIMMLENGLQDNSGVQKGRSPSYLSFPLSLEGEGDKGGEDEKTVCVMKIYSEEGVL